MKPILFSTPMIQAILDGRKSQTRRVVKPQYQVEHNDNELWTSIKNKEWLHQGPIEHCDSLLKVCPFGKKDEILWVKELHYRYGYWRKNGISKTGKQKWLFIPDKHFTEVRYFDNPPAKVEKNSFHGTGWYKRNSLFMPREACRLFLEVTDVRVERLHNISIEDASAEGIQYKTITEFNNYRYFIDTGIAGLPTIVTDCYRAQYAELWDKINGKTHPWSSNPWVFVITFKRIEKPSGI